jgi:hypothetical protein
VSLLPQSHFFNFINKINALWKSRCWGGKIVKSKIEKSYQKSILYGKVVVGAEK